MAGRGPAPKDPSTRRRRNAEPPPAVVLAAEPDDEIYGPDLPDGIEWPEPTKSWWENWRRSPQAKGLTVTDWDFLTDTALLHARYWAGDAGVAGELRLRVAKFGATPEDRMRLRMQVGEPTKPSPDGERTKAPNGGRYAHLRVAK